MNVVAFVLAVLAAAFFFIDWCRGRSLLELGLAFFAAAWIVQLCHPAANVRF